MSKINPNPIERRALWVAVAANLLMAFAGYYFYYLTDSEMLFLDGNFSMIAALVSIVTVYVSTVKHQRSEMFPYGLYLYESLVVFFKGLVLLGIILMAVFQNVVTIIHYCMGEDIAPVSYGPILYYALGMGALCFCLVAFFKNRYKATNSTSPILLVEANSLVVDGFMSLAVGASFLLISWIPLNSPLAFLHSIGDALLVVVISLMFLKLPLNILTGAFVELGGGKLQDKSEHTEIVAWIKECMVSGLVYKDSYINKAGSNYLAVIYVGSEAKMVKIEDIRKTQSRIETKLKSKYPFNDVEIIVT